VLALLALLAGMSAAAPAPAQDAAQSERDKIFEQVFGRKPQAQPDQHTQLPLVIDDRQVAELPVVIPSSAQQVKISAEPLLAVMKLRLLPAAFERLAHQKTEDGFFTLDGLKKAGLATTFDETALVLLMTVPPEVRAVQVIDIAGRTPAAALGVNPVPTADVSSYFNVRGGLDYLTSSVATGVGNGSAGLQPLNLAMESATNVMGNVLQGYVNYIESGLGPRFQRGNVSLIHDDPDAAVRYQAGDLSYPVTGFQAFEPLGGITIARNFSLKPYELVQPGGQQEFVLQDPSRVEVLVNGQPMQFLQLPAGRYSLRDFPFTQGTNNVQLVATNSAGQTSVINSPYFFSTNLLAQGQSEFSYSLGVPSIATTGVTGYETNLPAFSGFHRFGLTDALTLGLNLQGDGQQQLLGGEISAANVLGSFRLDVAGSHGGPVAGSPLASSLQWSYYDAGKSAAAARGIQFSATYRGANFAPLGTSTSTAAATTSLAAASPVSVTTVTTPTTVLNPDKLNLALGYIQALPFDITGGISGTYGVERDAPRTSSVDLSFRRFLTPLIMANLDLNHTTGLDNNGYSVLLTLSFQLGTSGQTVTTSYDTQHNAATANWSYTPPVDVDVPAATVTASNSDQQRLLDGAVTYNTSRFETTLTQQETMPVGANNAGTGRTGLTNLQFGTALVFADGHFAIGRPVADSFALVVPHPTLAGLTVGVDPIDDYTLAEADALGPGVLSNLSSYRPNEVRVTVPKLPLGYDLGPDVFTVSPSFDSGAVIHVGKDAVVLLDGIAVGVDGKPIALADALATPTGGKKGKPLEFFTNRSGRFRIPDMNPGSYDLTFPAYPNAVVRITIPPGTVGIYRIGTIKVTNGSSP
jgi:outer membrane usher protein